MALEAVQADCAARKTGGNPPRSARQKTFITIEARSKMLRALQTVEKLPGERERAAALSQFPEPAYLRGELSRRFTLATTIPVSANSAMALGSTIRLFSMS